MTEKQGFTVAELFEQAKKDDSWEPDADMRAKLADGLLRSLIASLS